MASLGKVCAVGIGANMLIAVFLLPAWWRRACAGPKVTSGSREQPPTLERARTRPSSFYQRRPVAVWVGGSSDPARLAG